MDNSYHCRDIPSLPSREEVDALLTEIALDRAIRRARPVDKPLALYGAGTLGRMAREYFDYLGIPIRLVVDANAKNLRKIPDWQNICLLCPDEVTSEIKRDTLLSLCIATTPYAPIAKDLSLAGWKDIVPFYDIAEHYRERHPLSNGWFAKPFSLYEQSAIAGVLQSWHDDISRAHHLQFLAWRRLRQEWRFRGAEIDISNRFFIPEVCSTLRENERFLDAGSHVGQVIETFLLHTKNQFEHIFAIEPDPASLAKLNKLSESLDEQLQKKIEILSYAIADKDGKRSFVSNLGYASQCWHSGLDTVTCRSLDTLDLAPTFVKLHLEGMELAALYGARQTLCTHRPILTSTVYHNEDGLWRTAHWLQENLTEYALFFRLHSWCGTGATIYAIPNERTLHSTTMGSSLRMRPSQTTQEI